MTHKQITNWCRKNDIWYLKIDIEMLNGDGQRLQRSHQRLKDGWKIFHTKKIPIDVYGLCYWNPAGLL
jgi:hypothetical protein